MKTNRRTALVVGIIVNIVLCLAMIVGIKVYADYVGQQTYNRVTESFDKIDQDMAIRELSELRGMILEVEDLSFKDIPQNVLLDELESITSSEHYTNKYLVDFAFETPNTSNVQELCGEFISQIDKQIDAIKYGAEGE